MNLSPSNCKRILDGVFRSSKADETLAALTGTSSALTRFANNGIHQNVAEDGVELTVRVVFGKRTAKATTNRLDLEALRGTVELAERLAKLVPEEDLPPMPGPCRYRRMDRYDSHTARLSPRDRARGVADALTRVKARSLTAAGYLSNQSTTTAVANSAGLFAFDRHTQAEFSMTAMAGDSSGWVKGAAPKMGSLNLIEMTDRAIDKASQGKAPRELDPGAYTVILEPAAVADLLGFMTVDFGALMVHLKQSFLTDRLGSRMFGDNVTVRDDVRHPLQMGLPFDGDGLPRRTLSLVEKGVVKNLVYSLSTAHKLGKEPTGHGLFFEPEELPMNFVMEGGDATWEEMIASTDRGLLVTRFWYIREVDPAQKILTGMTRDGTFFINQGRISHAVKNLRFNQSLIEMLRNIEMMGRSVRASGEEHYGCMVVPAMKVGSFHFTGKTVF